MDVIMFFNFLNKGRYMNNVEFEIRFVHKNPVDLIEMANSLISLNNILSSHIGKEHGIKDGKILLSGVKEGSDIYSLVFEFGAGVLPLIAGANTVLDAVNHIKSYLNIGKKSIEEIKSNKHYTLLESDNIQRFISPILSNDDNSKMEITVNGNVNAPIIAINSTDAKLIKQSAEDIKKILSSNEEEIKEENNKFEKVLIKMYQMKDTNKIVKDSCYCDDIVKGKAIATIIEDSEAKKEILANAFNCLFLVDIVINKIDDEIKLYRVVKLHELIQIDNS